MSQARLFRLLWLSVTAAVEARLHPRLPYATVFTHLEPAEDPRSFDDTKLDRAAPVAAANPSVCY